MEKELIKIIKDLQKKDFRIDRISLYNVDLSLFDIIHNCKFYPYENINNIIIYILLKDEKLYYDGFDIDQHLFEVKNKLYIEYPGREYVYDYKKLKVLIRKRKLNKLDEKRIN